MWDELLPALVGGTLTDDDAPTEPTEIVGYQLTEEWVEVQGKDFSFGSDRRYVGITAAGQVGEFRIRTMFGMGATVTMPKEKV